MKFSFSLLPLLFLTSPVFALFCPTNFNQIQIGDSLETVQQQCGKPDEEKKIIKDPVETGPVEWGYYVQQNPRSPSNVRLSVVFNQGKVINLSVNGAGVSRTALCNTSVKISDTMEEVKKACGQPMFINKGQTEAPSSNETPNEIIQYKYHTSPPVTLIFEKGILQSRLF